jgi:hypothetical protein
VVDGRVVQPSRPHSRSGQAGSLNHNTDRALSQALHPRRIRRRTDLMAPLGDAIPEEERDSRDLRPRSWSLSRIPGINWVGPGFIREIVLEAGRSCRLRIFGLAANKSPWPGSH